MREIESEILSSAIDCNTFHEYAPEYGWRAWKAKGKFVEVVYWDLGNVWCSIIDVIPVSGKKVHVINFYKKLQKIINKSYDESGFRIS